MTWRHSVPVRLAAAIAVCAVTGAAAPAVASAGESVRGIIISTHGIGEDWATERMHDAMVRIRDVGAGWVAIHPYAAIRADGTVSFDPLGPVDPDRPPGWLVKPIRYAHALGLKILIKPHLAYWGSPFAWRGEIEFDTEEQWARFWNSYERWTVTLAAAAKDADAFSIGTELDRTLRFEAEWRRVIRATRRVTEAPLTYAANWTDYERVPFWDALDAIGIQAYFPLTDETDTSEAAIRRGWDGLMARLRAYSHANDRTIVFTEIGYNRSHRAPVEPWAYRTDGPEAAALQQACMRIALEAIEREPSVVGAFLWKWFPEPRPVGYNFQLATPGMMRAIRDVWAR